MSDITQYTNIFSSVSQVKDFVTEIYKYTQNPLVLPIKTTLIGALFTKLRKVIDTASFKRKLEKDMKFQSMFTGYMMEVDTNTDETSRLEKLRKIMSVYIKSKNEGSKIEAYEIYQIARKLKSFEFVVLANAYKIYKIGRADHIANKNVDVWRKTISEEINDSSPTRALIFATEDTLTKNQLIYPIREGYSEYHSGTFRLTDLGVKMCELLEGS